MKKPRERRLADFVHAPAADEQLLELWSRVERAEARRLTRVRRSRQGAAGGAVLAALIAVFALLRSPEPAPVAVAPPSIEASIEAGPSDAPRELSLADGSQLFSSPGTRARVLSMRPDEVRVRLERGQLECEVAPEPKRRFVVEAGAFEVVVTGTRFTVVAGGEGALASNVVVSVERGSVEVREPPNRLLAALGPGQLWASDRFEAAATPSSSASAASSASAHERSVEPPPDAGSAAAAPASRIAATPARGRPPEPRPDAPALLARASDARRAGKLPEAVAALEEILRRHPSDARAGYAAFLLGRIRLDSLGDARGAVEAFAFAVAHPGGGFFAEDAEARWVEALAKAKQNAECLQARERFLAKYPRSARAASMKGACREK